MGKFDKYLSEIKNIPVKHERAFCVFLGLFLLFFPFSFLADVEIQEHKYHPQNLIDAGDVVLNNTAESELFLNHKEFSAIEDTDFQLAVVSVYSPKYLYISEYKPGYPNWRESLKNSFRAPKSIWKRQRLEVKRQELEEATNLRLPSSVKRKLNKTLKTQKRKERKLTRKILSNHDGVIKNFCYQIPIDSRRNSPYGKARRLPSGKTYYHTGLDLRAWLGTPIENMGPGKVAYKGFMTSPGNNVIINHGGGLFSRYMHFSKFGEIEQGKRVPASTVIGYSGSTGRSQAPHLHFEVIWKGNHASPLHFLRTWEQICDPS